MTLKSCAALAVFLFAACGGPSKATESTSSTSTPSSEEADAPAVAAVAMESIIGVWQSPEGAELDTRLVFCEDGGALISHDGQSALPAGRFDLKSDEAIAELYWMNDDGDEQGPITISLVLEGESLSVTAESGAGPELQGKTMTLDKTGETADCNE